MCVSTQGVDVTFFALSKKLQNNAIAVTSNIIIKIDEKIFALAPQKYLACYVPVSFRLPPHYDSRAVKQKLHTKTFDPTFSSKNREVLAAKPTDGLLLSFNIFYFQRIKVEIDIKKRPRRK